ncbi:hypothetical protein AKJ35_01130 [candidate division MSBL1 archaeon SCGC-AAA833F18]|uniref:Uncharacterized protein n=1 Tax=candidate division MSBL1 archaeon SCGC-AAA833F18 TaxID=1698257 RepID=A0A133VS81_9EURY|nr:hypothetical protein AKJ35_01130 [candidate division MSBL1 archaeon SCGC-AAA833F18]
MRVGANKDEVLAMLEESPSIKSLEVSREDLQLKFEIDAILKAGQYLKQICNQTRLQFTVEKREITEWLLNSIRSNEAKAFIRGWLGKKYDYQDFPVMEGIINSLGGWRETNPDFVREVIDILKNANRYQVRRLAFEAGYNIFDDEGYFKEAEQDPSQAIRKWVAGLE